VNYVYDPSLVIYLPLHKLDGSSMMSQDAYGHLCTVTGALWTPQGRSFDGVDDYISTPDHATLDGMPELTIVAWVNFAQLAADKGEDITIVRKRHSESPYHTYLLWLESTNNKLRCQTIDGVGTTTITSDTALTAGDLNTWMMVSIRYDGATTYLYRDLTLLTSGTGSSGALFNSNAFLYIGVSTSTNQNLKGIVGSVLILRRDIGLPGLQHIYLATKWRYQ